MVSLGDITGVFKDPVGSFKSEINREWEDWGKYTVPYGLNIPIVEDIYGKYKNIKEAEEEAKKFQEEQKKAYAEEQKRLEDRAKALKVSAAKQRRYLFAENSLVGSLNSTTIQNNIDLDTTNIKRENTIPNLGGIL